MKHINKIIILLCILTIIGLCYGIYSYSQKQAQLIDKIDTLEFRLGVNDLDLYDTKVKLYNTTNKLLNARLKNVQDEITINSMVLLNTMLVKENKKLKSYSDMAETILEKNGIYFKQFD